MSQIGSRRVSYAIVAPSSIGVLLVLVMESGAGLIPSSFSLATDLVMRLRRLAYTIAPERVNADAIARMRRVLIVSPLPPPEEELCCVNIWTEESGCVTVWTEESGGGGALHVTDPHFAQSSHGSQTMHSLH